MMIIKKTVQEIGCDTAQVPPECSAQVVHGFCVG
jgi:hypothetical protein